MTRCPRLIVGLVSGLVLTAQALAWQPQRAESLPQPSRAASAANPQRFALLIGVTDFQDPRLKGKGLKGPANDVDLFRHVLTRAPLSVPGSSITVLKRGPDPTLRPTRANIHREFIRLANVSKRGDQIVILMAGHGSQQPANADPTDEEPDGLDEIFLPEDVSGWDGTLGRVKNAIVDDEIRAWVDAIRNTGAFVWLLFDACHSGTMTRGSEMERQIPMSDLVPADAIPAVTQDPLRSGKEAGDVLGLSSSAGDVVALYAAHMSETTPEKPLPHADSPIHGLFTYTVADILSQTSTALTYRELAMRVLEQYRSVPRYAPTPLVEGGGVDREVLGQRTWPERPQILLGERHGAGWTMRAGSVHGLTVGSVLEVFPPAGATDADTRIGHLKVVTVEPTAARAVPTAYDGMPVPDPRRLTVASRARVRYYEFGDLTLKVALQSARVPQPIERALATLSTSTNGLAVRATSGPADWHVKVIDNRVVLAPAAEASATQFTVGAAADPKTPDLLVTALRRIARARNLMRLGAATGSGLRVDLRVTGYPNATTATGRPLFTTPADVALRAGEFAEFRVRNASDRAVDVTVLYVDAAFGIQPLYPVRDREVDNQLKPGEERVLGRFPVTDAPLGWESAIAIAVESTNLRQNFSMLAQESLDRLRGRDESAASPLRDFLERAMFGAGGELRRGAESNPGPFAVKVVTWRTEKAAGDRPAFP